MYVTTGGKGLTQKHCFSLTFPCSISRCGSSAASISSLTGLYVAATAARPGTSRVLTMDGCCMASSSASKAPCESNHPDPQPELTYACRLAGLVASWISHARLSSGGELQGPQAGTGKMYDSPGGLLVDYFVDVGRRPPVSWPIHPIPWAGPSSGRPTCFRDAHAPLTHPPSCALAECLSCLPWPCKQRRVSTLL